MSALHDVRAFVRRPWGSVLAGTVAVAVVATSVVLHRKKMMARSKSSFTSTAFQKR